MCIRIHIFCFKQNIQTKSKINQKRKQKNKRNQRRKREKKCCCCQQYLENLTEYNDIVCKFALCIFNLSCKSLLVVQMNLTQLMCNERNHSIFYTITRYEVHIFQTENKGKSLRDTFVYYFLFSSRFICGCKFIIIETRA